MTGVQTCALPIYYGWFVGGERIDTSKGLEEYWKTLKFYKNKNKRLGYGDNEKDWSREIYENNIRELKIQNRIMNRGYSRPIEIIPQEIKLPLIDPKDAF